jgi:hypothetical protein
MTLRTNPSLDHKALPIHFRRQVYSGVCRCGHAFDEHHLGAIANEASLAQLPTGHPPYVAQECEYYDCNEGGGMGPDGRDHCHHYVDREDPERVHAIGPGTFTCAARLTAWARAIGQIIRSMLTGKRRGYTRQR